MTLNTTYSKDLEVKSQHEDIDQLFFNRRFKALYDDLVKLDAAVSEFGQTENTLVQLGLDRLNETLGPLLTTLQNAANLGFLVCQATGVSVSLTASAPAGFNVTDGADLFTPTPYLLAEDINDSTNWGILHVLQWTKETGDLATTCVYASKTQASTSWTISCNSALPAALMALVATATTASDAAVAANASVTSQLATLASAIAAISSGPVASVAGRTGVVTLGISDIANLTTTLGALATISSVNTLLAGKQNASAKLETLAAMTWAANKIIYATGAATLGTLDITDFAKTILTGADAATVRSTIGAASPSTFPTKASTAEVLAGADDAKYITALGAATAHAPKLVGIDVHGPTYTLQPGNLSQLVFMNGTGANTLTIPSGSTSNFPTGWNCLVQMGPSATSLNFVGGAGTPTVSIGSKGGRLKANGAWSMQNLIVLVNDGSTIIWMITGDIIA